MSGYHFMSGGRATNMTMESYTAWFARNQRIGTVKTSVVEYCLGKLLNGLESPNGTLYRLLLDGDEMLTDDGISVELRQASMSASQNRSLSGMYTFQLDIRQETEAVIFSVRDNDGKWKSVLDLDAWCFYVISADKLRSVCGSADRISLQALTLLSPEVSGYDGVPDALWRVVNRR